MKKISRNNCVGFWTVPTSGPCDECGDKQSDVILLIKHFWGGDRTALLCYSCRRKWLNGEIDI